MKGEDTDGKGERSVGHLSFPHVPPSMLDFAFVLLQSITNSLFTLLKLLKYLRVNFLSILTRAFKGEPGEKKKIIGGEPLKPNN